MSGNQGGGSAALQVGLLLAAAFGLAMIFAMWQIGAGALRDMGLILVSGITLALVIGASALPIRAWRRKDNVGETHFVDGTKTIIKETRVLDGRAIEAPKIYQLPAQSQGATFPEILRTAYRAGAIATRSASLGQQQGPAPDYIETDLQEVDLEDPDGWTGDITMRRP